MYKWGIAWGVSNHWELVKGIDSPDIQKSYIIKCLENSNMLHVKATSILPGLEGVKIDWPRILRGVFALQIGGFPYDICFELCKAKKQPTGKLRYPE